MNYEREIPNPTLEQFKQWYAEGYEAFNTHDVPVCPYKISLEGRLHWWLGYTDAEEEACQHCQGRCEVTKACYDGVWRTNPCEKCV